MGESKRGLLERLNADAVICAEGYLFELERRGYLSAGAYVPEVVLDHPDAVRQLHREFLRAGSDVIEAFTYYGHREKLRIIGKEDLLEPLNRQALELAKEVAQEATDEPALVAGNICNTNIYDPGEPGTEDSCRAMFAEQVGWAADAGVDFVVGETFTWTREAEIALEIIKQTDLPAVVTLAIPAEGKTRDGDLPAEACRRLEDAGADVVGLNCYRGPATTLELLEQIRERVSCHVAGLPVPYRTNAEQPTFFHLPDPACDCLPAEGTFPIALDPFTCNRFEMAAFARACYDAGIRYIGVCCGGAPHHVRAIAEALGRRPPASRYSPDLTKHFAFGTDESLKEVNVGYRDRM